MKNNLANIFRLQRFLQDIKYPDKQRIAREISEYTIKHPRTSEETIIGRLKKGEPWEYVKGSTMFCHNSFLVTTDTLIPRIETEQLVYEVTKIVKLNKIKNIVDVGTGSGCISISIADLLECNKKYNFYATDIKRETINVAKKNEKNILKKEYIKWIKTDLIEGIQELKEPTFIVANLPYIPTKQYEKLDKSVKGYEPRIALDGGTSGLDQYEKLFKQINEKDINVSCMYIETEESIFEETKKLIKKYFKDKKIHPIKDVFERNRFLLVCFTAKLP
jgi:release factor glutamine methyltransferase